MVGDAPLREVVGADAFGAVAAADQRFAFGRDLAVRCLLLFVLDARGQHAHGLRLVLVLRAAVLAFDDSAGRDVRDAHGGVGLVDVLAARAGCAKGIDAQLGRIQFHFTHFIGFRQDRHGAGRGVDAALGFGGGHTLHTVRARLEFQYRIRPPPDDARDDFLVATHLARTFRDDLDLPAAALGESRVHAKDVARKQGGLVATGAGAHFEKDVAFVIGVFRQQLFLQFDFELFQLLVPGLDFGIGKFAQIGIGRHFLGGANVGHAGLPGMEKLDDGLDLGAFAIEFAEPIHVARGFFGTQQTRDFIQALGKVRQLGSDAGFHSVSCRR